VQLNKAEAVLRKCKEEPSRGDCSAEFYSLLPLRPSERGKSLLDRRTLYERFELCQLLRDMMNVSEASDWSLRTSAASKYSAIGALIRPVESESSEFAELRRFVLESVEKDEQQLNKTSAKATKSCLTLLNAYEVIRPQESVVYEEALGNERRLFHGTDARNMVGILSRGLLLPKCAQSEAGSERSDAGLLGAGIYFSDSLSASLAYAKPSVTMNTRLVCLCDVALGECSQTTSALESTVSSAPDGFQSVQGLKRDSQNGSRFRYNEFAIYKSSQQRVRYLLELQVQPDDGPIKQMHMQSEPVAKAEPNTQNNKEKIGRDEQGRLDIQTGIY
jgi:poly [ADP-ribose] polymerase 2/3/4